MPIENRKSKIENARLLLALTLPLYALDQLTKWLVLRFIAEDEFIPVIPNFFNLIRTYNTGAAFSIGQNNNGFFLVLAAAVLAVLLALWFRGKFQQRLTRAAVALLLAGIAGNLTDRLIHGHVIDFLDVILPWYGHWPAFNVADSCICVAAGLLLIGALKEPKNRS
ncbi:MAG TPA: signal peptidase II [Chthoniobacterales bacterium]